MSLTLFADAIQRGDLKQVEDHLSKDPTLINQTFTEDEKIGQPFKTTPLLKACMGYQSADLLEFLIEKGADVNHCSADGYFSTPLTRSVEYRNREAVEVLLKNGAFIDQQGFHYESALIIACKKGFTEIAGMLLASGAEVNPVHDNSMGSPLRIAVENEHIELVKLLLEKGAIFGRSSLNIANRMGKTDVVEALLASESLFMQASYDGDVEEVKQLLDNGADTDTLDARGRSALILSLKGLLLSYRQDYDGITLVELLLDHGVDVNIQSEEGDTALLLANISRIS